jgi:diguanylate cyclase (GGDEF)-like protein
MTGLFNRRCFDEALACHRLSGAGGALLMVDLDGFKGVNDHLGHAVGDELLRSLSASLQARSRTSDVLARLSGDEFALLLPGADRMAAEIVAEQVVGLIGRHRSGVESDWARVTASVGVASPRSRAARARRAVFTARSPRSGSSCTASRC